MKNWLGQEIEVGSIVYRGARDGNTSSFRIGEVIKVDPNKSTVRVDWLMDSSITWSVSAGNPGIDSLFVTGYSKQEILDMRQRIWDESLEKMLRSDNENWARRGVHLRKQGPWWDN